MKKASSSSIKTTNIKIQNTFEKSEETVKIVVSTQGNQQENFKISIKKHQKIIQGTVSLIFEQTKDLRCFTRLLHEKLKNMSEVKKAIVWKLGFDGLMQIPPMNVPHKLLKDALTIKPKKKIGAAFSLNASGDLFPKKVNFKELSEENKELYRRFHRKILKNLADEMMDIGVDTDQDRLIFKKIFILYIQMTFLLPTTINKVSPIHMPLIFRLANIREWNWGSHVLDFIIKGISQRHLKKKKSIDGCLCALMIIYFHETKYKNKNADDRELLVQRIKAEHDGHMGIVKREDLKKKLKKMKEKEKKEKKEKDKKKKESSSESDIAISLSMSLNKTQRK
ncbi:hypothetical protein Ahy_B01g053508 [Arachis hypogaea]|uniref:DUF1985 domain-containing protein n=1 Tax=Arachis hypogaea TaxID=3818 RepID=A0A445ARV7_ARAHY|nr:hypothetical protein Ahy_B01g053508 [Arachis hypogaea]